MSETVSSSANRAYGLARVCRVRQVARSTIYHRRSLPAERQARRPGPVGAATDADLIAEIRAVIETAPFHGEGYRKVPPRACCTRFLRNRIDRLLTIDGRACAGAACAPPPASGWRRCGRRRHGRATTR